MSAIDSNNASTLDLIGEFECKVDPKGRVALPATLLRQLPPDATQEFVLTRGFEQCLSLYPSSEWQRMLARVKALDTFNEKQRRFQRQFLSGSCPLSPDGQHRLLLPRRLLSHAGISDVLIMSTRPNALACTIELWEPSCYEAQLVDDDAFSEMAQDVMSNKLIIPLDQD